MSGPPVRLGTFLLSEPIGEGGMGTVWKARHPERVDVAVKVLRPDYGGALLDAFRAEVRSVASLDHPHVVQVYDYGVVPDATAIASQGSIPRGSPWLAMEYGDNGTLGDRSTLPDFEALQFLMVELLEGLAHAHARGMVHRDLKPRNVLLFATPGHPRAALTDFGIAHLLGRADPNAAQAGTPGYMAPEQIRGERWALGPWTDLYALGCVIHRMSTGRAPFAAPNKLQVLRAHLTAELPRLKPVFPVPAGFEDFWRKMMSREPEDRYLSAADALTALRGVVGVTEVTGDWRPRHPPTTERPRGTGLGIFLLRPWPLTGRDREQEATWSLLLRARARRRVERLVFEGARGTGKTRMLQWLARRSEETGLGEAWRFPSTTPVRRRLRALLHLEGVEGKDLRVALTWWLRRRGAADPAADADALKAALEGEGEDFAWWELFRRLSHERAAVLLFDDLDDAIPEVRRLFDQLCALPIPALVAATVSTGEAASPEVEASLQGARRFRLEPLSEDEQHRLVAFAGLSAPLAASVVARAAGNPWFLVRAVTEWARAGGLVPTTHGYDLRPGFDALLPDDLMAFGLERVEVLRRQLPGSDSALCLLALLGGRSVREDEWRAVCTRLGCPWQPARLVSLGAVRSTRVGRAVRYDLVDAWLGDVLLQAATREGRRRALHLAAAECLLEIPRVGSRERAVDHLAAAGERDRAIDGLRALVDEAFHHDRTDRVAAFLERERALLGEEMVADEDPRRILHELDAERLALLTGGRGSTGTVLERASRSSSPPIRARALAIELQLLGAPSTDRRWADCRRLFSEARDLRSWRQLVAWRVRWRSTHGEVAGALADAQAGFSEALLAEDQLDRDRFEALDLAVRIVHRHRDALPALTEARARATAAGRAERAAQWLAWSSAVLRASGELAAAAAAAEQARGELAALGLPTTVAAVQLGHTALAQRRLGEAGGWFGRVLAEEGLPADLAQLARAGLLVCAADAEQWDLWDRTVDALTVSLPDTDDPGAYPTLDPDVTTALDQGALVALHKGEVARARDLLRIALRHHLARRDAAAAGRTRQRLAGLSATSPVSRPPLPDDR
jgi:hypothetical protein